ncbi:SH2 domain containing 1A duplicate a isoform X1 [Tachysurus fulvidraco]|uniref:SH2 domain containing 1A duplicate a isoform X1 n=1 Tax=Tachysurus fulvidraco TaxID=1234273 RepID=UPI000F4F839E|nr:SH2 domain containing 1A duplicate a isoform X1 [Tachysurus fulvidraco]
MEELEMYHGAISKEQTERILGATGQDGSFLIRDSETVPGSYCICVLFDRCVFTYRLYQLEGNVWKTESFMDSVWEERSVCSSDPEPVIVHVWTAPGVKARLFRNVQNLLSVYKNPDQGIAIPLRFPVKHVQRRKPPPLPKKHIPC